MAPRGLFLGLTLALSLLLAAWLLPANATTGTCNGLSAEVNDTNANHIIDVTDGIDNSGQVIVALGTDPDLILAGTGDDTICAGEGDDEIFANAGEDRIYGEEGDDFLSGDSGDDVLLGDTGVQENPETQFLGHGVDQLYGGDGADEYWDGGNLDLVDTGGEDGDVDAVNKCGDNAVTSYFGVVAFEDTGISQGGNTTCFPDEPLRRKGRHQ